MKQVLLILLCFPTYYSLVAQRTPAADTGALQTKTLREVIVSAKKKLIEQKADRTIVNVDAMPGAAGGHALDVLSRSPGVVVDMNGNISLNGKQGVLVLIDERPTYMTAQELADYLRSLPAGLLDRVELMSNPPARYDASGSAIINIVLKKNHASGFNGSITAGYTQGVYARSNGSLNVNYRGAKYNLFGNASEANNRWFSGNGDSRYFYNDDGSLRSTTVVKSRTDFYPHPGNARLGVDYFASARTTIGMMLTGSMRPRRERLDYAGEEYKNGPAPDSLSNGYTDTRHRGTNYGINLNGQQQFGNKGGTLTADVDYIRYVSDDDRWSGDFAGLADSSGSSGNERFFALSSGTTIRSVKADYTLPLKRGARLEAGIKSSYVSNDNRLDWYDRSGGLPTIDYSKSDHFLYDEQIDAAYTTLTKDWKRWSMSGGLRAEHTVSKGYQPANPAVGEARFTRRYTTLFPSLYVSYKLDTGGQHTLSAHYSTRIHRPGYQQLNPFLFYQDRYTYSSGNPALPAGYAQYLDLRYAYSDHIGITFSYSREANIVYNITRPVGNLLISRPENFTGRHAMGVIPYVSFSPFKCWSFSINGVLMFYTNDSGTDSTQLVRRNGMHEIELFNQFHFGHDWSGELNGFFPGRQTFGQSQGLQAPYNISAGLQKTILNKKLLVRVKVDDIFHTMTPGSKTVGIPGLTAFRTSRIDSRQLGLSVSYRFGKAANARKRNHNNGGAGDEEKRTN